MDYRAKRLARSSGAGDAGPGPSSELLSESEQLALCLAVPALEQLFDKQSRRSLRQSSRTVGRAADQSMATLELRQSGLARAHELVRLMTKFRSIRTLRTTGDTQREVKALLKAFTLSRPEAAAGVTHLVGRPFGGVRGCWDAAPERQTAGQACARTHPRRFPPTRPRSSSPLPCKQPPAAFMQEMGWASARLHRHHSPRKPTPPTRGVARRGESGQYSRGAGAARSPQRRFPPLRQAAHLHC
jgi:hypothetical protein